ncbi:MAG: tRNA (adenosine(37)-N6)-dimethylallyltransferase MiaA [Bacteroidota bacterium]
MEKTVVVLAGPTAVGKTACGIELAAHFKTEIISADSRQIYRETSIGTAVPSPHELAQVKHHFIQVAPLTDPYHASRYEQEVLATLERLFKSHDLILLVGGSGLYIDAVCHGIDELPSVDPQLRSTLLDQFKNEGLDPLVARLKVLDPVSYDRVDLKNHMRVLKALEVSIQTGKPYSTFLSSKRKERPFRILRIALDIEREVLYDRINKRVDQMMEAGLLDEVKELVPLRGLTAMKTVGYRELFRHLDGEISLDEAVDLIRRNTRKFARKQLTWFRKENRYRWFSPGQTGEIISWIESHAQ